MKCTFYKYQGTGNDFIIVDNRQLTFDKTDTKRINQLCDRRFGIGADGLILLEKHDAVDFRMVYFNADGNQSTMCGNGGRCTVAFAKLLGIIDTETTFMAIDGEHHAFIDGNQVKLQMQNVDQVDVFPNHVFLDTGSPHHVQLEKELTQLDIKTVGSKIRYGQPYNEVGANVNFVDKELDGSFSVRTYERGVENETLSCGTGVTAVALAMHAIGETEKNMISLHTPGGNLQVSFNNSGSTYNDIWLLGPATLVFKGDIG